MKKIFSMNRFEGWNLSLPLIQGGMGVGVSLSGLAGAVASEGGMGVISTAQIGFEEPDFVGNEEACNLRSIRKHIVRAKDWHLEKDDSSQRHGGITAIQGAC